MDYKGMWRTKESVGDVSSISIGLFNKDDQLTGTILFTAKQRAEAGQLFVTLLDDSINLVTEQSTASGYTINFTGKPVDDNTIEGVLNIGIFTDREEKQVTFTRSE